MSTANGPWVCSNCEYENPAAREICRKCERLRPDVARRRAKRSRRKRSPERTVMGAVLALVGLALLVAIVVGAVLVLDDADENIGPPDLTPRILPAGISRHLGD
jgi:hypothetical protein